MISELELLTLQLWESSKSFTWTCRGSVFNKVVIFNSEQNFYTLTSTDSLAPLHFIDMALNCFPVWKAIPSTISSSLLLWINVSHWQWRREDKWVLFFHLLFLLLAFNLVPLLFLSVYFVFLTDWQLENCILIGWSHYSYQLILIPNHILYWELYSFSYWLGKIHDWFWFYVNPTSCDW